MVNEMDEGLIKRWNSLVKPNDTVYHLGDFCLTMKVDVIDEWLGRLNGAIHLVKGNHDGWVKRIERLKNRDKIVWVKDYVEKTFVVDNQKYKFVMCHFPLLFWHGSHYGSIHLHGHSHGGAQEFNKGLRRMDIGVDCNNWYPVSLENVVTLLKDLPLNPHHDRYNK